MNVFTTEHPLVSQPSIFDAKEYPKLSLICRSLVCAFVLTPLIYALIFFSDLADGVETTPGAYPSPSWTDIVLGIMVLFLFWFSCAFSLIGMYRQLKGYCQGKRRPLKSKLGDFSN